MEQWSVPLNASPGDCNVLTPVDICDNPLCHEFCIGSDISVEMMCDMSVVAQAHLHYLPSGGLNVSGEARSGVDEPITPSMLSVGGISVRGAAACSCSADYYHASGGFSVKGTAGNSCSNWTFKGGVWPVVTGKSLTLTNMHAGETEWQVLGAGSATVNVSNGAVSDILLATGFGFNIPSNASVLGIEVFINRIATLSICDKAVYLFDGTGIASDNLAKTSYWPYIYTNTMYGSTDDDWRVDTFAEFGAWTPEVVNNPNFGVAISAMATANVPGAYATINSISMNVYYEASNASRSASVSGSAITIAPHVYYTGNGIVRLLGARSICASYRYIVQPTAIKISGTSRIGRSCPSVGGPKVSGQFKCRPSWQLIKFSGGMVGKGFACPFWWKGLGGVGMSGTATTGIGVVGVGGFHVGSGAKYTGKARISGSGGVHLSGTCARKSSAWHWVSDGNIIFVSGSAATSFFNLGTQTIAFSGDMEIRDLMAVMSPVGNPGLLVAPANSIQKCGCTSLPTTIFLQHNIIQNNKLAQFMIANNQSQPAYIPLLYNAVNDGWQANSHLFGHSDTGIGLDTWNILFELRCTSIVGVSDAGRNLWLLSTRLACKNSVDMIRRLTYIMVAIVPDASCKDNQLNFSVDYNTLFNKVTVNPVSVVYQNNLCDNIGLFKNPLWNNNPILNFTVWQSALGAGTTETGQSLNINISSSVITPNSAGVNN